MTANLLIKDARPWGESKPRDMVIGDGRYVAADEADISGAAVIDAGGRLCVPGFIDPPYPPRQGVDRRGRCAQRDRGPH